MTRPAPALLPLLLLAPALCAAVAPSASQLRMMDDVGLAQFMHFSVDPWSSIEHNCVGSSGKCIPASSFNPSNLSTDQWVETAVAFGAKEICLTAAHEGGFAVTNLTAVPVRVIFAPAKRHSSVGRCLRI